MSGTQKRLFFGLKATSPWPLELPSGRLLHQDERHATLAFLGNTDWEKLSAQLAKIPIPSFDAGLGAIFDKIMFLPRRSPHVVCWHADFYETEVNIENYQKKLAAWLKEGGFLPITEHEKWLPHVTLARAPFDWHAWKTSFLPLPVIFDSIHLYESIGNLRYSTLWSLPLSLPFEEIEHTADMAFIIKGKTLSQIYLHAVVALAFRFPDILMYLPPFPTPSSLDDIIMSLNEAVANADQAVGCPFKAVSLHGEIEEYSNYLQWEMIVDV